MMTMPMLPNTRPGTRLSDFLPALRTVFAALIALQFFCIAATACAATVLSEKNSAYGPVIVIEEDNGMRSLRFSRHGALQSMIKTDDPDHLALGYVPVALSALALCNEPRRFLVIGVGGGTLPGFLHRHFPDAHIDAVDINPEVIVAAKTYFGLREDARLNLHVADGRAFIEQARTPYDAIFLDAFGSRAVPPHLTTNEFLLAVQRALRPEGVVIGNLWNSATQPSYERMVHTYRAVFGQLLVLGVAGVDNRIVLGLPRREPVSRPDLVNRASRLSAEKGLRYNFGIYVEQGWMPEDTPKGTGIPLRDAEFR